MAAPVYCATPLVVAFGGEVGTALAVARTSGTVMIALGSIPADVNGTVTFEDAEVVVTLEAGGAGEGSTGSPGIRTLSSKR